LLSKNRIGCRWSLSPQNPLRDFVVDVNNYSQSDSWSEIGLPIVARHSGPVLQGKRIVAGEGGRPGRPYGLELCNSAAMWLLAPLTIRPLGQSIPTIDFASRSLLSPAQ